MNINDALKVLESSPGGSDEDSAIGEAIKVVESELARTKKELNVAYKQRMDAIAEKYMLLGTVKSFVKSMGSRTVKAWEKWSKDDSWIPK